ncbi:isopenicillin N synthase family oxygenase [Amycolatopsis sp. CA-128772]|uniref:isopenicillin N synthase family dioxygenase n=1 Tax=Amycolatopsis sp. CA-128772 TaxID=2073159 RepID=UPI000CD05263|nr:2OG-Fe(II) oxygenase family protein [Amycolatopsis sp. CA-128772]
MRTFELPDSVGGRTVDRILGRQLVRTWEVDGIFQVAATAEQDRITREALAASRRFFARSLPEKVKFVSDLTYSGYIASGEEVTAGEADFSEIFTVCPDIPFGDPRVTGNWPCHGPVPWPDEGYRTAMTAHLREVGGIGERLLQLVALGLGVEIDRLTRLTREGWHHMRVLRFPARSATTERGIGAHTDYGLLVIAAQDDVGGLFVRPPVPGEHRNRNWLPAESTAGMYQDDEPWHFVEPEAGVFTVFPGDILQFLTGGRLLSTPHKVRLATRERYTLAYFHEPSFGTTVRPLAGGDERIHYGTHFTNMFTRCYPDRVTTRRIHREGRLAVLDRIRDPR